jgi:pimeloyl-ACP methyl ester carboxylesterase
MVDRTSQGASWKVGQPILLAILCLGLAGCGTPVSVERVDARTVRTEMTRDAVSAGRLSGPTQIVLHQRDLEKLYATAPAGAIAALHRIVAAGPAGQDELFALAEMAFLEGERSGDRSYSFATVIYAYAFLFPISPTLRPSGFDPRLRTAAELYNLSLTRALASADGKHVDLRAGDYALPFGSLSIKFDPDALRWADRSLANYVPAAELRVDGLHNRYRATGIGAPLAADVMYDRDARGFQVARAVKVPVTALLRVDLTQAAFASGRISGALTLYPGNDQRTVAIGGETVPLESEPSAAFAYALSNPDIWKNEVTGFLQGGMRLDLPAELVALEPYRPGRIPVVLIHGTASSAGRWADMINDLKNDPAIRDRFQFWLFTYDTGDPVPFTALKLRTDLEAAVHKLDPGRRDPALRNIVLIGHSQGGLLAKMLVINSGSALFDTLSSKPLDELKMSDTTRETIRSANFVTPEPDVTRVIFIATPHRGSFVAGGSLAQLAGRLVALPVGLTRVLTEAMSGNRDALRFDPDKVHFSSIYSMTPGSPFSNTLASIPVAPTVAAHSIIAVQTDGPVEAGNDGVVEYRSAHIDGVKSELVVRSAHSVQANPNTVAEVRRILLLQWEMACPQGCLLRPATTVATDTNPPRTGARGAVAVKQ